MTTKILVLFFFTRQGCISLNLPWLELHKASNRAEQVRAAVYSTALKVRILLPFIITVFPENLSPHHASSPSSPQILLLISTLHITLNISLELFPASETVGGEALVEWCRGRDLNASDAMLLQGAFRASFAPSSFSRLSALNSSSLLFTVTEAISL